MQQEDCTDRHLAVGYWQAARIHALLGDADAARKSGLLSLKYSEATTEPFYRAYACESLARAEAVASNREQMHVWLEKSRELSESVESEEDRNLLIADLKTVDC